MSEETLAVIVTEHRALDALLGRFFGASHAGALDAADEAIRAFDEELRRHTAFEEERFLKRAERKLVPGEEETEADRLVRELRLEHVQIRELSTMMRRLVEQQKDLKGAERLAPNLARRWDAHTQREEAAISQLGI